MTVNLFQIGVVEKGWADVNLTVTGTQGHSSTPPKETSIGILANAISNLEKKQQPNKFGQGVEYDTTKYVAPFATFGYKMILGNLWLFSPIVSRVCTMYSMLLKILSTFKITNDLILL